MDKPDERADWIRCECKTHGGNSFWLRLPIVSKEGGRPPLYIDLEDTHRTWVLHLERSEAAGHWVYVETGNFRFKSSDILGEEDAQ